MALRLKGLALCLVVVLLSNFSGGIQAEEKEGNNEEEIIKEEFVITLDHSNFSDIVPKHDFIVVEFYTPWCPHCKNLAPEYEKAASILSKHDPPITLAKVDASDKANDALEKQFGVKVYPTVKILRNGGKIVQNFKPPHEADDIVKSVKRQLGPASVEIKSSDDAAIQIDPKRISIVGIFPKFSGEEYENFIKLAEKLRGDYDFGHTLNAKFLPRGDPYVSGPLIRLLKPFDELFVDFKDFDVNNVEKFILEEDAPSVVEFNQDPSNNVYLGKFFTGDNTMVTMFLNFSDENSAILKSKFYDIGFLLKGINLSFLIADVETSEPLLKYFKLEQSQVPVIFIQESGKKKKYLKPNVEPDQLVYWFKKYLDGKVEQFTISEPIPLENNEPVKVVVLDSLQNMVFNSGKEVFLEFYAPWCGHCKTLAPILEEVAVSYEKDPNVLIAKFDATANDVSSEIFEVQGYPTMFFISTNGKMIEYEGGRTKEDIVAFIEEHRGDKKSKSEAEKKSDAIDEQKEETTSAKDEL